MEVNQLQREIAKFSAKWDKKRKTKPTEQATLIHIVEEIGELASQYVNLNSRKSRYDAKELENAIGDALMQLVVLADLRGLDIEKMVIKIIKDEEKQFKL